MDQPSGCKMILLLFAALLACTRVSAHDIGECVRTAWATGVCILDFVQVKFLFCFSSLLFISCLPARQVSSSRLVCCSLALQGHEITFEPAAQQ